MYNYFRWFPEGKIVFMAPTKPLVEQQVEACYKIVGIPPEETAELRGSVPPKKRRDLWFQRRVFFCTPQTFANDLQKGTCDSSVVKKIVCVVIDEAHKGTGNYAYVLFDGSLSYTHTHARARAYLHFLSLSLSLPVTYNVHFSSQVLQSRSLHSRTKSLVSSTSTQCNTW